jgi:hypothetical protein
MPQSRKENVEISTINELQPGPMHARLAYLMKTKLTGPQENRVSDLARLIMNSFKEH